MYIRICIQVWLSIVFWMQIQIWVIVSVIGTYLKINLSTGITYYSPFLMSSFHICYNAFLLKRYNQIQLSHYSVSNYLLMIFLVHITFIYTCLISDLSLENKKNYPVHKAPHNVWSLRSAEWNSPLQANFFFPGQFYWLLVYIRFNWIWIHVHCILGSNKYGLEFSIC